MTDDNRPSSKTTLEDLETGWDPSSARIGVAKPSQPNLAEVDSLWDFLDENDEAEEKAAQAAEPELPDERLDPVAYAEAKRAREERAEARRQKRRAKAEAKKSKQKGRADLARQKQKTKKRGSRRESPRPAGGDREGATVADGTDEEERVSSPPPSRQSRVVPRRPRLSTNARLLGVAIAVFVAGAAVAALLSR